MNSCARIIFFLSLLIALEAVLALPFYFCDFCATEFSFYFFIYYFVLFYFTLFSFKKLLYSLSPSQNEGSPNTLILSSPTSRGDVDTPLRSVFAKILMIDLFLSKSWSNRVFPNTSISWIPAPARTLHVLLMQTQAFLSLCMETCM